MSQPIAQPVQRLFATLDGWRQLPSYRLEPRVDAFVGLYLRQFLTSRLPQQFVDEVIPEFPLRKGTLSDQWESDKKQQNRSYKVDFALWSAAHRLLYLVEFKTSQGSLRTTQNEYLDFAKACGVSRLATGVTLLQNSSKGKHKYGALARLLEQKWGWSLRDHSFARTDRRDVRIVYLIPRDDERNSRVPATKGDGPVVLYYADLVSFLKTLNDPLATLLAEYFTRWAFDPGAGADDE